MYLNKEKENKEMLEKKSHAEILKEILEKRKMKPIQLARLADIPPTTVYAMLKRDSRTTEPETLAKISKALNIPISFWTTGVARQLICEDDGTNIRIDTEKFYKQLELRNRTMEYIKDALEFMGYRYSLEELKNIVDNQIPVEQEFGEAIGNILMKDVFITPEEFNIVCRIRSLSKESKELLNSMIKNLNKAEAYEELELKEICKGLRNK